VPPPFLGLVQRPARHAVGSPTSIRSRPCTSRLCRRLLPGSPEATTSC